MESVARLSPPPLLFSSTLTEYWTVGNYCISLKQLQQRRTAPTETERTDERRLLAAAGEDGVDEQEGQKGVAPGAGGCALFCLCLTAIRRFRRERMRMKSEKEKDRGSQNAICTEHSQLCWTDG